MSYLKSFSCHSMYLGSAFTSLLLSLAKGHMGNPQLPQISCFPDVLEYVKHLPEGTPLYSVYCPQVPENLLSFIRIWLEAAGQSMICFETKPKHKNLYHEKDTVFPLNKGNFPTNFFSLQKISVCFNFWNNNWGMSKLFRRVQVESDQIIVEVLSDFLFFP